MRSAPSGDLAGVSIALDGAGDLNPVCRYSHATRSCEGPWFTSATGSTVTPRFDDYTLEVVQQIGSDSFVPGHGVLIGKTKTTSGSTCGSFNCFVWYIDANPQDIDQVDFVRADGTPVKATIGDERQLNDGSFNAGLRSGCDLRVHGRQQQAPLLRDRQAHGRPGRAALHGRRPSHRRRGPADARREPGDAAVGQRRGLRDLHVPAHEHRRRGGDAQRPPAGRVGVLQQRHLPPVGLDDRDRLGGASARTRSPPRSSARPSRSRSTSPRRPGPPRRAP